MWAYASLQWGQLCGELRQDGELTVIDAILVECNMEGEVVDLSEVVFLDLEGRDKVVVAEVAEIVEIDGTDGTQVDGVVVEVVEIICAFFWLERGGW